MDIFGKLLEMFGIPVEDSFDRPYLVINNFKLILNYVNYWALTLKVLQFKLCDLI